MSSSGRAIQPGEPGPKGDPGGIVLGTQLGTANLNTIVVMGMYRQDNSANSTLVNNYPVVAPGMMTVIDRTGGGTSIIQIYYPITGTPTYESRVQYSRSFQGGVWSPWRTYASTRVDQTAGRAIYQWDELNNRDQLVYGDTGWRVVSTDLINGATGVVLIRRVGWMVETRFRIHMASATSDVAYIPPSGFGPGFSGERAYGIAQASGTITIWECVAASGLNSTSRANSNYGSITYSTTEAWPVTLPGTANGSIPNL